MDYTVMMYLPLDFLTHEGLAKELKGVAWVEINLRWGYRLGTFVGEWGQFGNKGRHDVVKWGNLTSVGAPLC